MGCGGAGTQTRTRSKAVEASGGGFNCVGPAEETTSCNNGECGVDCTWGPWGSWSACSKTCGGGTRTQTRIKSVVEANGGACIGKNQQEETCNQEKCQTCDDDILNQNEEKIDCGGVCPACPEEVPQDVCKNYNGIPHKRRPVCCHKKCPECGGKNWKNLCKGNVKDGSGKELGNEACCVWRIEKEGQTCGKNGQKAPCRLEEY